MNVAHSHPLLPVLPELWLDFTPSAQRQDVELKPIRNRKGRLMCSPLGLRCLGLESRRFERIPETR